MPAGSYYYKLLAVDMDGNTSTASSQGAGTVSADPLLPRLAFSAPTPASLSSVSGTVTLQADATPPSTTSTVSYGFDPAGFRRTRTANGSTTRFLLGGLIETTTSGTITGFDVDGPAGDLAHYTTAPTSAVNPSYSYYTGHGDLAAEADQTGTRTRLIRLDPWGQPLSPPGGSDLQELFTGRWDKKHDQVSSLIEMGARPYDPGLGRFLAVDPVDGGALNQYDYALQDPVNAYDLDGRVGCGPGGLGSRRWLDSVPGLYDFSEFCDAHDRCYGKWGNWRRDCDSDFKQATRSHCSGRHSRWSPLRYACYGASQTFFEAVDSPAGTLAFLNGQVGNCLDRTSISLAACVTGAVARSGSTATEVVRIIRRRFQHE